VTASAILDGGSTRLSESSGLRSLSGTFLTAVPLRVSPGARVSACIGVPDVCRTNASNDSRRLGDKPPFGRGYDLPKERNSELGMPGFATRSLATSYTNG